jgi:HEAT repeat protein
MGNVHGPDSVPKLIATVRRVPEFQIFEAASTALTAMIPKFLPQLLTAARDPDPRIRQLAIYSIGRKGPPEGLPALVAALKDQDLYTRFRAAHALQAYGQRTEAVEALLEAIKDTDPIVQDRAALSLAIALIQGSTIPPRLGLESAIKILATPVGALRSMDLSPVQLRALNSLTVLFRQFGDGSRRTDIEWGFRPVGNAMLAFGAEGGRRLQAMIDQRQDRRLAEFA